MHTLRIVWAVIVGTLIAFLVGAAFDYYRIVSNLSTDNLNFLFPAISALGGLIGSFAAAMVAAGSARSSSSTGSRKAAAKGRAAATEVPGMPTYDFTTAVQPGAAKLDATRPVTPPKEETRL